jgi:hypothetical protein
MIKRLIPLLFLALGWASGASASNAVLFQVVNLDCQFCGKMEAEGSTTSLESWAQGQGVDYRVGVFGPVIAEPSPYPHGAVTMFYAAMRIDPSKSVTVAGHLYRYFAEGGDSQGQAARETLIDMVSATLGVAPETLWSTFKGQTVSHMEAWGRTASVVRAGLNFSGSTELRTPSFMLIKDGQVKGFVEWQGDVASTESMVRDMVRRGIQ